VPATDHDATLPPQLPGQEDDDAASVNLQAGIPVPALGGEGSALADAPVAHPSGSAPSRPRLLPTVLYAVFGVAVVVAACVAQTVVLPIRWGLALVGLALVYVAFRRQLHRWRGPFADSATWLSTAWLILVVVLAALANVLPLPEGRDPSKTLTTQVLLPPSFHNGHLLGTDSQGLDVFAQLLFGARVSLTVGIGATVLAFVLGGVIGLVAGYSRGWVDRVVSFLTDVVISFPALVLLLALVAFLTPNQLNVAIALGVLAVPGYVRLTRANAIKMSSRDFVTASHTLGAPRRRIIFRTILPNVLPPMLAYSFITMSLLIVAEASLSYLGVGIQRPTPTWGNMIAAGQAQLNTHPSLILAPATALFLTVLAANMLGQRLQTRWGASS
jgi:peptide/nickel transport system permease protein